MKSISIVLKYLPFLLLSCVIQPEKKDLTFTDYPNLQIGFTTQNFQKSITSDVEGLTEVISFASEQGFDFIEIRDNLASLSEETCKDLADVAKKNNIKIIYEIQISPLDADFREVFDRAIDNMVYFPDPGILRTLVSNSEFTDNKNEIGWSKDDFYKLVNIANDCAKICKSKNLQFIIENFNEPFFGEDLNYFGITDFLANTSHIGFQFDMSNPYSRTSRKKADPEHIIQYMSGMENKWVVTHLKTIRNIGGTMQNVLTENPISVKKLIEIMGEKNVIYISLELAPTDNKQQCFKNHISLINYLKELEILKTDL